MFSKHYLALTKHRVRSNYTTFGSHSCKKISTYYTYVVISHIRNMAAMSVLCLLFQLKQYILCAINQLNVFRRKAETNNIFFKQKSPTDFRLF